MAICFLVLDFWENAGIIFVKNAGILCGYIDLNTRICGSTRIYAGIVASTTSRSKNKHEKIVFFFETVTNLSSFCDQLEFLSSKSQIVLWAAFCDSRDVSYIKPIF